MFANRRYCTGFAALITCLAISGHLQAQNAAARGDKAPAANQATRVEELTLKIGEQRVIPSDGVQSYSEGTKGIVDVRLTKDASQFIVVALAPGNTTLLFLMSDGTEKHYRIAVGDTNGSTATGAPTGVEARDNVRLDFYFVQMNRNNGYRIGIGWPGSVAPIAQATVDLQAMQLDSATAVVTNQALPRLDMAQSAGWAKILRQAAVVTANGEKASFSGGGEVNVAIQSALNTGIQKIPFGSTIEVEPRYDGKSGRIELRLHADLSELDGDNGTGIPGRTTAGLDTVVNLELGQSLVLGGLTARSERRSKTGLPFLSQIPILGVLFGSHQMQESESENLVVIVPSVVDAVSMQSRERVTKALEQYLEFTGDMDDVDLLPATPTPKGGRPAGAAPAAPAPPPGPPQLSPASTAPASKPDTARPATTGAGADRSPWRTP